MVKGAIPLLVAGMLVTGISNSLFNKYQDMQCVRHCDDPDPTKHVEFSQPVWQTSTMFLGEALCLVPVVLMHLYRYISKQGWHTFVHEKLFREGRSDNAMSTAAANGTAEQEGLLSSENARGRTGRSAPAQDEEEGEPLEGAAVWLFFGPAACDICGSTLMNIGLLFTPVSIYQMTRGALVLWVGIFSVIFLRRSLYLYQWLCLVAVMLGVSIVGLSGTLLKETETSAAVLHRVTHTLGFAPEAIAPGKTATLHPAFLGNNDEELPEGIGALFGVLLILFAQIFTASQFVLEEKIMSKYSVEPLLAVGFEGLFGLVTTLSAQVLLHFLYGRTRDGRGGYFDMWAGWYQIIHTPIVFWTSFAIALSIALFNFFGLSVTRNVSATARSTIDTCRTLGIWVVSLALGWEVFRPLSGGLQILGFVFLCYGTLVFNNVVKPPKFLRPQRPRHPMRRSTSRHGTGRRRTRSHSQAPAQSRRSHSRRAQTQTDLSASMPSLRRDGEAA